MVLILSLLMAVGMAPPNEDKLVLELSYRGPKDRTYGFPPRHAILLVREAKSAERYVFDHEGELFTCTWTVDASVITGTISTRSDARVLSFTGEQTSNDSLRGTELNHVKFGQVRGSFTIVPVSSYQARALPGLYAGKSWVEFARVVGFDNRTAPAVAARDGLTDEDLGILVGRIRNPYIRALLLTSGKRAVRPLESFLRGTREFTLKTDLVAELLQELVPPPSDSLAELFLEKLKLAGPNQRLPYTHAMIRYGSPRVVAELQELLVGMREGTLEYDALTMGVAVLCEREMRYSVALKRALSITNARAVSGSSDPRKALRRYVEVHELIVEKVGEMDRSYIDNDYSKSDAKVYVDRAKASLGL